MIGPARARAVATLSWSLLLLLATGPAEGLAAGVDRPLIGITADCEEDCAQSPLAYARAIFDAGGLPVVVPIVEADAYRADLIRRLGGLVLIGGRDVPPAAYGEAPHPSLDPMPEARWVFERRLIESWLETGKPLLGVCLGAQMTNVVLGGSLVQDIPSQVGRTVLHRKSSDEQPDAEHDVTLVPGTRLRGILGAERIRVVSSHHQAVKRLGCGLRPAAHSADGVIEALEKPAPAWVVLLQWHPERMSPEHHQRIFRAMVAAARDRRPAPCPQ